MFKLTKTFRFEAGHQLMHHDGACRDPHGHSYILKIEISSQSLIQSGPKTNMVLDFHQISDVVNPMIDQYFDHKWLNDTLSTESPTSEYIAQWIFKHLKDKLPNLTSVNLSETVSSEVTYSED